MARSAYSLVRPSFQLDERRRRNLARTALSTKMIYCIFIPDMSYRRQQ